MLLARPNPWRSPRLEREPRNDSSVLRLPRSTQTRALQHLSRDAAAVCRTDGVRRTLSPLADDEENQHEADGQVHDRHAPGHQAEAGVRRFGVNFGAEFLNKSLRDRVFGIATRE